MGIGFLGLGAMGEPMATNLARAGNRVLAWNRTPGAYPDLVAAGAELATDVRDVFARCDTLFLMLADDKATDAVLGRGTAEFTGRVRGRTLITMATTAPSYSKALEVDVRAAGGHYVEAPVSGSRRPAQAGQLVAMLAGEPAAVAKARSLMGPLCRDIAVCGAVPNGLTMKLAVNIFLITMVTGLAEAMHFGEQLGLDLEQLGSVLAAGPMASSTSTTKTAKLLAQDFAVEAAIANVFENNRLIAAEARHAGIASPLLDVCHALYGETMALDLAGADMIAVIRALEQRTRTA